MIRRTTAQKLADERAALLRKFEAIQSALATVDEKLTPAQEAERDEEDKQLGVVARLLLADDAKLKGRLVAKASEVYRKDNRHRKAIQRVLGPITFVADQSETSQAPSVDPALLGPEPLEFSMTKAKDENLSRVPDAAE